MLYYINKTFSAYISTDEYITITYVLLVGTCFGLYQLHKKLKFKNFSSDVNDSSIHSMDHYTLSFKDSEVAIASSSKKIGILTKLLVWGLIAFFVVTPFYEIIPLLEPKSIWEYSFMNCFSGLLR